MDDNPTRGSDHPDPDLLSDLAAQVLAPDLTARIDTHVLGCPYCAGLLAEAEGMQSALRSLPPEPIPADLAQRLDRTLAAEIAALRPGSQPASGAAAARIASVPGTWASDGRTTGTGEQRRAADVTAAKAATTGPLPTRRSLREGAATGEIKIGEVQASGPGRTGGPGGPAGTGETPRTSSIGTGSIQSSGLGTGTVQAGAGAATGAMPRVPGAPGPATGSTGRIRIGQGPDRPGQVGRLRRVTSSRSGARRQALEEQRSDRPSRITQLLPALRVAAAVILVVGVGGLGIRLVQHAGGGDSSSADDAAGSTAASAPVLTPVLQTGTNYTRTALSGQVKTLVTQTQTRTQTRTQAEASRKVAVAGATAQPQSSPEKFAAPAAGAAGASDASGDLLTSDTALRACLTGIGEPDAQPVAVDLARYDDRDAAILVIPADDGSYGVWVVARNCTAENQGTIAVIDSIKP